MAWFLVIPFVSDDPEDFKCNQWAFADKPQDKKPEAVINYIDPFFIESKKFLEEIQRKDYGKTHSNRN